MSGAFLSMGGGQENKNHCPCETDHQSKKQYSNILKYVSPCKEKNTVKWKRENFEAGIYNFS